MFRGGLLNEFGTLVSCASDALSTTGFFGAVSKAANEADELAEDMSSTKFVGAVSQIANQAGDLAEGVLREARDEAGILDPTHQLEKFEKPIRREKCGKSDDSGAQ